MWEAIGIIAGKLAALLIPGRKEQMFNELKKLEVEYSKALQEGRDTDAAVARKQMSTLRKQLGVSDL
jgi:hypothetical protein